MPVSKYYGKKDMKKKRAKDIKLGSGLADKAKKKILSRREQIEKALKDAGA